MIQSIDLQTTPGHLIRRAQQIAVAIFAEQLASADITPVQFAILNALLDSPGIDQVSLAKRVAFDPATSGSVIGRLEAKGWVVREADRSDRRRKLLVVTPLGVQAMANIQSDVARVQEKILAPLTTQEQSQFVHLLSRLVQGHQAA
ncbi:MULTISPECIES: MarR family winged helix-turn-helix transcriptional regulator [unclassified Limnohabitans]|uniref:MarR family winged helix-turn-helix transcriptional regulator n=1 Tax=unclassified Limnohabitans TaxID=2626134 RepID=UPI000B7C79B8|nr:MULTISPECIES: MarR family winged helix-turn-helix transcriptional regulator [unclassified Limnohabitans]PUE20200.1 MarR family transcriptional regulator [Limnohabitans sp. WS1]